MRIPKAILYYIVLIFLISTLIISKRFLKTEETHIFHLHKIPHQYRNEPISLVNNNNTSKGPFNYERWYIDPSKPKKTIKVKFLDYWGPDPTNENRKCIHYCDYLSKIYNLDFSENPDFVFFSVVRKKHLKYKNCVKIFFTGENIVPDFNYCDYAISLNNIDFNGRHFRTGPLLGRKNMYKKFNKTGNLDRSMTKRKFCNFIYSDNKKLEGINLRNDFFKLLSEYKRVDAPGKVHNNMNKDAIEPRNGGWRAGKLDFIKDYKFTIAFENSNTDGYTTEKLSDALFAHSIPIYFGNPKVGLEYNKKAFIHVNDYDTLEDVVKKVIELDNDDDAYMAMLNEPPLLYPEYDYDEELLKFMSKVIERGNRPFTKNPFSFSIK